jgi:hypothetical protein
MSELSSWYFADGATSLHPTYSPEDVVLYPNPTSDIVHVEWPTDFAVKEYIIRDAQGQLVIRAANNYGSSRLQLDISSFSAGSYVLVLVDAEQQTLWRAFLVQ